MFIAVDGIDGAGKTTLVNQLRILFEDWNPVITKEPTKNSHWGNKMRKAAMEGRLPREKEIEYFHNDRMQHIAEIIRPVVERKGVVITDRYVDSTLAFQTDTPTEADMLFERFLSDILVPDLTFILCCLVSTGLDRIESNRGFTSQFENLEVLERARKIYESRKGNNYALIDASGSPTETLNQAVNIITSRFSTYSQISKGMGALESDSNPDRRKITQNLSASVVAK